MIASLRNGLADGYVPLPFQSFVVCSHLAAFYATVSLSVTRHHRTLATVKCRPRHIHLSTRSPEGRLLRLSGTVVLYPPGSRFVSTVPPPTTTSSTKDLPPPIANVAARKPKVDLHPAPVKPTKPSAEPPSAPTPTTASAPQDQKSTATEPHHDAHSSSAASRVIETAKEDYNDAAQHGILAPPPEGASWAGRMYHQAKELFVCCLLPPSMSAFSPAGSLEILLEWCQTY